MSSGNKEEAKVMEVATRVKKSNAFDVIVAAATEERFRCHMIDVLSIGLSVRDTGAWWWCRRYHKNIPDEVVQTVKAGIDLFRH